MRVDIDGRIDRFRTALERNAAEVVGPVDAAEIGSIVSARAQEASDGRPVAVPGRDAVLERYGVSNALATAGLALLTPDVPDWRSSIGQALVGVTGCVAASAETGTVALACGPGAPRAVSLTPDLHLCVVPVELVDDDLGLALARATAHGVPANLVWISGPSRSADIEKRITLGVHGPRTLTVVLAAPSTGLSG